MRKFIKLFSFVLFTALITITGCRESTVTQHSNPPPNDQELTADTETTVSERAKQQAHNRYIVIFKEQPPGLANSQAAQQAVEKTNTIFSG